jgi:hypothetical protein
MECIKLDYQNKSCYFQDYKQKSEMVSYNKFQQVPHSELFLRGTAPIFIFERDSAQK